MKAKNNHSLRQLNSKILNKYQYIRRLTDFNAQILPHSKNNRFARLISQATAMKELKQQIEEENIVKIQQNTTVILEDRIISHDFSAIKLRINKTKENNSKKKKNSQMTLPILSSMKIKTKQIISKTIQDIPKNQDQKDNFSQIFLNKKKLIFNKFKRQQTCKLINESKSIISLQSPQHRRYDFFEDRQNHKRSAKQQKRKQVAQQQGQRIKTLFAYRNLTSIIRPWQVQQAIHSEGLKEYVQRLN